MKSYRSTVVQANHIQMHLLVVPVVVSTYTGILTTILNLDRPYYWWSVSVVSA